MGAVAARHVPGYASAGRKFGQVWLSTTWVANRWNEEHDPRIEVALPWRAARDSPTPACLASPRPGSGPGFINRPKENDDHGTGPIHRGAEGSRGHQLPGYQRPAHRARARQERERRHP